MTTKRYMQVVQTPHPQASILKPTELPMFKGAEDTNLACGQCKVLITVGVDVSTLEKQFAAPYELLVRCPKCDTFNRLPSSKA